MNSYKVALAVNRPLAESIFKAEDLDFLASFAEFNPLAELPDVMTYDFMRQILPGADACITCWGTPAWTSALLDEHPSLRLIAHAAGSVKNLIPADFWRRACRLTSNAPVIAEDVAQTTLALILCSLKQIWHFARQTRSGQWSGGEKSLFATRRLDGLTVGVVSASLVGKAVIKILQPYRCRILLYDPYLSQMDAHSLGVTLTSLPELMAASDVVTLHAPAVPACSRMINATNLPLLPDGALLINTARGMLIDEAALIRELQTGRIFACLDVTDPEPPAPDHPFRSLDNVVLTPHIAGGHTSNGRQMLGANSINEVYNYLHKGLLSYEVRPEMLGIMA
jgi:phosphoglycerate dehydrogenase-like enzyme